MELKQSKMDKVYLRHRKNTLGEYTVLCYAGRDILHQATYYTDDWEDAKATAEYIANDRGIKLEIK